MRLPAAAEWITAVERHAQEIPGLVATVGKIEAKPGATNVIAGEARMTLDVRHGVDETRDRALDHLIRLAEGNCAATWIVVSQKVLLNQPGGGDGFVSGQ